MDFLSKYKRSIFILIVIALIATIAITQNNRSPVFINNIVSYITAPFQKIFVGLEDWAFGKINNIKNRDEMAMENDTLKEENELLKIKLNRLEMIEKENEAYKALLELSGKYPELNVIGAEVIGYNSNNWSRTFIIDKGTKHGLKENMVVLSGGGLCGKITKTFYNSSLVTPIIDDSVSVGAETKRWGNTGFIRGDIKLSEQGLVLMNNIDIEAEILVNDEIVTSNLGEIYPPGIVIGHVTEVKEDGIDSAKYAYVKPVAQFSNLKTVLVVTDRFEMAPDEETSAEGADGE